MTTEPAVLCWKQTKCLDRTADEETQGTPEMVDIMGMRVAKVDVLRVKGCLLLCAPTSNPNQTTQRVRSGASTASSLQYAQRMF